MITQPELRTMGSFVAVPVHKKLPHKLLIYGAVIQFNVVNYMNTGYFIKLMVKV